MGLERSIFSEESSPIELREEVLSVFLGWDGS